MATSNDVCTEALRLIGVVADDEPMQADQYARALIHMTDIFATLNETDQIAFSWTIETVPDGAVLPFARAIAGSVAGSYGGAQTAAQVAMSISPRKSLYEIGIDGLREYAATELRHTPHTTAAQFF